MNKNLYFNDSVATRPPKLVDDMGVTVTRLSKIDYAAVLNLHFIHQNRAIIFTFNLLKSCLVHPKLHFVKNRLR